MIKESGSKSRVKSSIFWLRSLMKFSFMVVFLVLYVSLFPCYSLNLGIILYLCFSSLIVYTILRSGWRSKSKFSFLGRLRGGAQIISYEIALIVIIFFFPCVLRFRFKVKVISTGFSFINLYMFPIFIMWIISIIAETNRSPFDFAEGERELVSGFKTEYRGMAFALLFLGEYGKIIFLRIFTCIIFFPKLYIFKIIIRKIIIFFFLWFRGTFPRFRYDFLMKLAWKGILPISLLVSWILLI